MPSGRELSFDEKVIFLKLLEMQRNSQLMFTSCGWFFDDITGIETIQILLYAARAIQLAKEIDQKDFEPEFENILKKAPTNVSQFADCSQAYEGLVKTASVDLNRVAVHFAISSIFTEYKQKQTDIYCYSANADFYDRIEAGIQTLATGRITIQSKIVLEKYIVDFAVLHLGDHNLFCAACGRLPDEQFLSVRDAIQKAFRKGDITDCLRLMNITFTGKSYSLWHLFKDEQRHILYHLLETTWKEIELSFRHIYEHNYTIMQVMRSMNMPLPKALAAPAEFILNHDLCQTIREDDGNLDRLKILVSEASDLYLQLDKPTIQYEVSKKIDSLFRRFENSPADINLLTKIETTVRLLLSIVSEFNLQTAQNVLYAISKNTLPQMLTSAGKGDPSAQKWVELFRSLANYIGVTVQ